MRSRDTSPLHSVYRTDRYCKIVLDPVSDLDYHRGEVSVECILYFTNPHPAEGPVTPLSKSRRQSAYPLSPALVLIYVYWHAISCSITFTCQTVNQRGSAVMGGNSIRITSCPHCLVYLRRRRWQRMSRGHHARYLAVLVMSERGEFVRHIGLCSFPMWIGFADRVIPGGKLYISRK